MYFLNGTACHVYEYGTGYQNMITLFINPSLIPICPTFVLCGFMDLLKIVEETWERYDETHNCFSILGIYIIYIYIYDGSSVNGISK